MYSQAKVITINNDGTVLVGCSSQACQLCKAQMFCNSKSESQYLAVNSNKINLKVGDEVELFLPPGKTVLSSFIVFAFPLLLFPCGYFLFKSISSFNEVVCALGGFAFMGLAFAITSILSIRKKKSLMPVVVKIVE